MQSDLLQYRFGVNYTPTRSWWYCWNDFEATSIARDLDTIAALGADHIRVMLLWPCFQPNAQMISAAHLERLDSLMQLAGERKLDVCVALFVGWLSGYAFKPAFQADDSFYSLTRSRNHQELYVAGVAEVVKHHHNFLGFDLGNELNCCWKTQELDAGDQWNRHMLAFAEKCVPAGIHVNGVDHAPWFDAATFSPKVLATSQAIIPLHCWTFFTGALDRAQNNCFDDRCIRLPEAMAALARAYAGDPAKPIWIQEFGMSEDWIAPGNIPRFLQESVLHAMRGGVSWFTWWCSHDLDRRYAFDPLEYSLGLITHDQQIKPQGDAFRELAHTYGRRDIAKNETNISPPIPHPGGPESTWQWIERWLRYGGERS